MFKDNQVSTVLLLCALAFLIWYLNKPANVNEQFADSEVAPVPEIKQKAAVPVPEVVQPVAAPSKVELAPVINEVKKAASEVVAEKQGESEGVFNFQDNDINMDMAGADLDAVRGFVFSSGSILKFLGNEKKL